VRVRRIVAVVVVTLVIAALLLEGIAGAQTASSAKGTLRWRSCGGEFECTSMRVPLDYGNPAGAQVNLAVVRLPASDQSRRIGSLVVNPGGPGGSGVDFVLGAADTLPSELRERFDIVGFDPRGTGQSDPVNCKADMSAYYRLDFSPDDDAERAALVSGIQAFVDACARNEVARLPFLSTDFTIRDLDELRAALGDDELTFLGYSYGSYLGAKYAEAYPDHVRALVLDGAVDPSLDAAQQQVEQSAGFEGVLDGFLKWCASNSSCDFHRDGRPARALDRLLARVDRDGLDVPGGRERRSLSPIEFDLGLASALYEGREGFHLLGSALDAADRGDGRSMAALADSYTERNRDGSYGNIEEAFLAIGCSDGPPVGTLTDVLAIEEAAARAAPRLGRSIVNNSIACSLWPVKGAPAAPVHAPTAPPILVVGTKKDPATPFAWARSLADQLGSGVLVTAPGEQHTAFGLGIRCVDDAVVRYFVDGTVPRGGLDCTRSPARGG
jgi:pimeloyl-ACP methyl ester carboxylesterase